MDDLVERWKAWEWTGAGRKCVDRTGGRHSRRKEPRKEPRQLEPNGQTCRENRRGQKPENGRTETEMDGRMDRRTWRPAGQMDGERTERTSAGPPRPEPCARWPAAAPETEEALTESRAARPSAASFTRPARPAPAVTARAPLCSAPSHVCGRPRAAGHHQLGSRVWPRLLLVLRGSGSLARWHGWCR